MDRCGQDIARTMQLRLLKLDMYTSYGKNMKPVNFQDQRSMLLGHYKEFMHFIPCGHHIGRTMQPMLLKFTLYTSYGNRKKFINFQGRMSRSPGFNKEVCHLYPCGHDSFGLNIAKTMQPRLPKLSMCTSYGKGKNVFEEIMRSLNLLYTTMPTIVTLHNYHPSWIVNKERIRPHPVLLLYIYILLTII